MKLTVALLIFVAASTNLVAQKEEKFTLELHDFSPVNKVSIPFRAIKIADARFDQELVGSVVKNLSFKGITQQKMPAVFPEVLSAYLPKVLLNVLTTDSTRNDTLVVLLKQFRVTDHISSGMEKRLKGESVLTISCSFYASDGRRLTKLSSANGMLAEEWPMDGSEGPQSLSIFRKQAAINLLQKLFKNQSWLPSTTSFLPAEMEEGINRRLALPLWKNQTPVAGVYRNFEEFRNNSPSVFDVEIGRWADGNIKEVRDKNANVLLPKDFWGLCDGKNRYVSFQNGSHRLQPSGNNFRFVFYRQNFDPGSNQFNRSNYSMATPDAIVFPMVGSRLFTADNRMEFLYLNLEDGSVHLEEVIGTAPVRKLRNKSE